MGTEIKAGAQKGSLAGHGVSAWLLAVSTCGRKFIPIETTEGEEKRPQGWEWRKSNHPEEDKRLNMQVGQGELCIPQVKGGLRLSKIEVNSLDCSLAAKSDEGQRSLVGGPSRGGGPKGEQNELRK